MSRIKHPKLWIIWLIGTVVLGAILAITLFWGKDKSVFMPGEMTGGHHLIGVACETCHTDSFTAQEDFQQACLTCHEDEREKPFDSHPMAKFRDPRNASLLEEINATQCITCHVEHRPEATLADGVTQPIDFCVNCHAEVADNRPSHEGLGFETCASAGCHNYHDNRALYTEFLIKHLDEPGLLETAISPEKELAAVLDQLIEYPHDSFPVQALGPEQADAPSDLQGAAEATTHWATSAHAENGANCSACHVVALNEGDEPTWHDDPGTAACSTCHSTEVALFGQGKHGMKSAVGLPPLTPKEARLPMHGEVDDESLTCNSCHAPHEADVVYASVEACETCHADQHTESYRDSKHFALWEAEQAGSGEPGSGVSCATCHMPRESMDVSDWVSRVVVNHNNSASLSPIEKMLRPACLNCHGLEYSLSALADQQLLDNNFQGQPEMPYAPMDFARNERERIERETGRTSD